MWLYTSLRRKITTFLIGFLSFTKFVFKLFALDQIILNSLWCFLVFVPENNFTQVWRLAQQLQNYVQEPRPFVKWAGGKRQLLHELERNYPKKFDTYFEPFLGGGAVMFNLLAKHPDMKCHVSDLNSDLILAYLAIRDKVTEVIESLENHAKKYQKNQS